jgi:hypothetical protein
MFVTRMSIVSVLFWFFMFQNTTAWNEKRNAIPKFPFDPETAKSCTWWLDNEELGSWTCQGIEEVFEVSVVDFMRWVCVSLSFVCKEATLTTSGRTHL